MFDKTPRDMANSPEEWYNSLPPITRTLMTCCFLSTCLCSLGFLSPFQLHLDLNMLWQKFQVGHLSMELNARFGDWARVWSSLEDSAFHLSSSFLFCTITNAIPAYVAALSTRVDWNESLFQLVAVPRQIMPSCCSLELRFYGFEDLDV